MITRRLFTKDPNESWASIVKGLLLAAAIGAGLAYVITG